MFTTKAQTLIKYSKLTSGDIAKAIQEIHSKKMKERGAPIKGHRVAYSWTLKHTAKMLKMSIGKISTYLREEV